MSYPFIPLAAASDFGSWTLHLRGADIVTPAEADPGGSRRQLLAYPVLMALLGGECRLIRDSRLTLMQPGVLYICRPGSTMDLEAQSSQATIAVLRIGLYAPSSPDSLQLRPITPEESLSVAEETPFPDGRLEDVMRSIYNRYLSGEDLLRWQAQADAFQLLVRTAEASEESKAGKTAGLLERARRYIDGHLAEPLTMEQISAGTGLSAKHFADVFKKAYGASPHDYMTQARLEKAKRLMLQGSRKLKDVAHAVGYEDEFYFSRLFKKEHGLPPSRYVAKRKVRTAAYGCPSALGYLLPLGVLPLAAPMHPKWSGYYIERFGADIPCHLDYGPAVLSAGRNLEILQQAQPDLILCPSTASEEERRALEAIGSVMTLPEEEGRGWERGLRELAETLGLPEEAGRWISRFERRTSQIRSLIAAASGGNAAPDVLPVRMFKDRLYTFGSQGIMDFLYRELGLGRPPSLPDTASAALPLELEQIAEAEAGRILLLVCQESETLEHWERLSRSPEWLALPAVRRKSVIRLPSSPWREYSPIALERIGEEALRIFGSGS